MNEVCRSTFILFPPPSGFYAYRSLCLHAFWFFIILKLDKNHDYSCRVDLQVKQFFGMEHFNSNYSLFYRY